MNPVKVERLLGRKMSSAKIIKMELEKEKL
jgi:hypothetical protein